MSYVADLTANLAVFCAQFAGRKKMLSVNAPQDCAGIVNIVLSLARLSENDASVLTFVSKIVPTNKPIEKHTQTQRLVCGGNDGKNVIQNA